MKATAPGATGLEIAIVGMSCHFPGAASVEEFLDNLRQGVESIRFFTDAELAEAGVSAASFARPSYVKAGGVLEGIFDFDATAFGYTPREAELIDPQQRLFLERASEALERAGHDPERFGGAIGVYAGVTNSSYAPLLLGHPSLRGTVDGFQVLVANDRDFLASRVAYKLNLQGPAVVVQTACSTSLAAVHIACQALLAGDCDLALAGGVSVRVPHTSGYLFQPEGIASPDGHCRPFDARAQGTVPGNGVGVVVLRRLADALESGDRVAAVIRGSAINNDGGRRLGFTAPRIEGQAQVIRAALALAEVDAATVGYVEAHGTATALGDPIEIAALNQVFAGPGRGPCAIGSVKSNFGHLDAAAGVAGLMKAVLSLEERQLFPTLHFEGPNPKADFASGPFRVNGALAEWKAGTSPRRAGVSSFGMGGTNVHAVLEEAPEVEPGSPMRGPELIVLSARTDSALEQARKRLAVHLRTHPDLDPADVAFTLAAGRRQLEHRAAVAVTDLEEAAASLDGSAPGVHVGRVDGDAPVAFLFPGQGAQRAGMAQGLYPDEPVFRSELDVCREVLRPLWSRDLHEVLKPEAERAEGGAALEDTALAQPALFAVEYALACLWKSWGVVPQAMIGHSVGEYVAACLAGVMDLPEALSLLVDRGRLMAARPAGAMFAVLASEAAVQATLEDGLTLAAVNAADVCVVAGPVEATGDWARRLNERGTACTRLRTSHAFHSPDMDAVVAPFRERVSRMRLREPKVPFLSNVTGTWITAAQAQDPGYWASQLRATVQFSRGIDVLRAEPGRVFLEVGPGNSLAGLARRHGVSRVVGSLPSQARGGDGRALLDAAARLWVLGAPLQPEARLRGGQRRRVLLPTYPFERRRYAIEPPAALAECFALRAQASERRADPGDWLSVPSWHRLGPRPSAGPEAAPQRVLILADEMGIGSALAKRFRTQGHEVVLARAGRTFEVSGEGSFVVDPGSAEGYEVLFAELVRRGQTPQRLVHLASLDEPSGNGPVAGRRERGFFDLLDLVQAASALPGQRPSLTVVTHGAHEVTGAEVVSPFAAMAFAATRVIGMEDEALRGRVIDVDLGECFVLEPSDEWLDALFRGITSEAEPRRVALRGRHFWAPGFAPLPPEAAQSGRARLRFGGVYLITGGLGGIGLALATHLAETEKARLVLISRSGLDKPGAADQVARLERAGAQVLVVAADVTDRGQMAGAIQEAERRFGTVHGVVHAAGVPGAGLLQVTSRDAMAAVLAPKVHGTLVLDELFRDRPLDFMVLCSSLTGTLGALGQADYAAANAFQDAFAQKALADRPDRLTVAIAWDTWRESGMAVAAALPAVLASRREELLRFGLTDAEGAEVFRRALHADVPRVLVSTRPFEDRAVARATQPGTSGPRLEAERQTSPSRHPRPALQNEYVAPCNGLERSLAEVFERVLGLEGVGVTDNFFELGGESLAALRLVALLKESQGLELSLVRLYESPTIAGLARTLAGGTQTEAALEVSERRGGNRALALAQRRQGRRAGTSGLEMEDDA
jgi:phthiocerol/phenolphthiocerol synthesis type-I polyketide synthase E